MLINSIHYDPLHFIDTSCFFIVSIVSYISYISYIQKIQWILYIYMILYYEYEILTSGPDRTNATALKCWWESMAGVQSDHLEIAPFFRAMVQFIPFLLEMLPKNFKNRSFSFFLIFFGCTDKHEKSLLVLDHLFFVYSSQHDRVGILYCNTPEPGCDTAPQTMDVW